MRGPRGTDPRAEPGRGSDPRAELSRIERLAAALRWRAALAAAFVALLVAAILFVAALSLPEPLLLGRGSLLPFVTWALFAVGVLACIAAFVRNRGTLGIPPLGEEIEGATGLRPGEVLGALELRRAGRGESAVLADYQRERVAAALRGREPGRLLPRSLPRWRRRVWVAGGLCAVAVAAAVLATAPRPGRAARTARALAAPWAVAFPPPLSPIRVSPGDAHVPRGEPLAVRLEAPGRERVRIVWRVRGEVPRERWVAVGPGGRAEARTDPVEAPIRYWVDDGAGTARDTFSVTPVDPLLLVDLRVELSYPSYLGRSAESLLRPLPPLVVPEGTRITVRGTVNHRLRTALVVSPGGAESRLGHRERDFSGVFRPRANGTWRLRLSAVDSGLPGTGETGIPIEVTVVPDSLPSIEIAHPGADTAFGPELRLPLILDARDDGGLASVDLVSWNVPRSGPAGDPRTVRLGPGGRGEPPRRLILRPILDGRDRGLVPGDLVAYYAVARDGHPAHPPVLSDTFRVRLPSPAELRRAAARETEELARAAGEAAEAAARIERRAREAAMRAEAEAADPSSARAPEPQGSERGGSGEPSGSEYRATEEGREVLREAEALRRELASERERLAEVREELERASAADPELRARLERLEELYRELLESGLGERIEELRRALRELDPRAAREALERLSSELRRLRERLDETVALMERVAVEQALKGARERAEELAARQTEVAAAPVADSAWADEEARLAAEAERLAEELERLEEKLAAAGQDGPADSALAAGRDAEGAAEAMRAAGEAADRADSEAADSATTNAGDVREGEAADSSAVADSDDAGGQRGAATGAARASAGSPMGRARSAAGRLQRAASRLQGAERQLARDWKAEALEAVERAAAEALQLAREQARLTERFAGSDRLPLPALRGRQAALRRGLDNLLAALAEASRRTALLDRRTGPLAARAVEEMDRMLERLAADVGAAAPTVRQGRATVEALNDLAERLLASSEAVRQSSSATGMEEALERMSRISQAQGGLNRQAQGMMLLQQGGRNVSAELRRLAERQAEIARRLRELGSERAADELPGNPGELAGEAERIAERLREQGLDRATLERQERLFQRLLDAGRSLERDDRDPRRRESETARPTTAVPDIPELPPELRAGPRYPHPDEAALRSLPPALRRMVYDYFDRLNREPPADERRGPEARDPGDGARDPGDGTRDGDG